MKQIIPSGYYNALNVADTEYSYVAGGSEWSSIKENVMEAIPTPGTIRNLRIELNDVPGTGTYTFTLHRAVGTGAWANTTLTCTVAADGTIASDTEHNIAVAAGDVICLECNPDSPDNARYARWTVEFEGDNANESLILSHGSTHNTANRYVSAMAARLTNVSENDARQVCPTSGKIKNLHVLLEEDPGTAPDAYRFVLRVDGADSDDGEGNALECTITADNRTGNDTTHEITVSAGDILTVLVEPLNSPSATAVQNAIGMTFVADTDGESLLLGGTIVDLDDTATEYHGLMGAPWLWTATEAEVYQLAQECTLKKLYMLLSGDPGGTDKYTFTVRLEGASPSNGLVVEIAGGSTTGNDTTNTIAVSDGEVVNMMVVPTDTPAFVNAYWGLVCFIEPAVAGGAGAAAELLLAGQI